AERIRAVQPVGSAGERGAKILSEANLDVAAPRFFRDPREAGVWKVREQRRLKTARADARWRLMLPPASHAYAIHHHRLLPGALDHLDLADEWLTEAGRAAVLSVAQNQNDRAAFTFLSERRHRLVDGAPERRGRVWRDAIRKGS